MAVADLKTGYRLGHADVMILNEVKEEILQRREAAEKPVAWTDEQELLYVERDGCGYLFTVNPITPNADMRRVIPLFKQPPFPVVPSTQYAVAWMVVRDGDPTFPRLFKSEEEADFMVKQVELNPKAVKVPLGPLQALPVVPDEKWVNPDIHYADENQFAEGWNACRAAMLQRLDVPNATSDVLAE